MRKAWFILFLLLFIAACGDDDVTVNVVCDNVPCIIDNSIRIVPVCDDEDKIERWKKHGVSWDELYGWHQTIARPMGEGE